MRRNWRCILHLLAVPVDLFDVRQLDRQHVTALSPTRLQDPPTILRLHPLTETMHAQAAANFGLPGTLYHKTGVLRKKTANRDSAALSLKICASIVPADRWSSIAYGGGWVKVGIRRRKVCLLFYGLVKTAVIWSIMPPDDVLPVSQHAIGLACACAAILNLGSGFLSLPQA